MSEISFGTDGWRAVIAEGFTFANVRCVSEAIARHLSAQGLGERGIVVGFDTRFLAEKFALVVAEVMAGNNTRVFLCKKHTPTPVVAHAVTVLRAGGAAMLTASHNPAEYLGIKFIPAFAGPALPSDIEPIVACMADILQSGTVNRHNLALAFERGLVEIIEPQEDYRRHVKTLIDLDSIGKAGLKIAIDPMYGAGIGYLDSILAAHGCKVEAINNYRDPLFGGSLPEPAGHHLNKLSALVQKTGAHLGLALDGDADRLGVIDPEGKFYSPNEILILFLDYLVRSRGWRGPVARTVATTHMLDRICDRFGFPVVETPVGFKYIGQAMREQDAFLGGEESGGISIRGHVPEKDGILAGLLFAEMLAKTGKTARQLLCGIYDRYGRVYSERIDLRTTPEAREEILARMNSWQPDAVAGLPVTARSRLDGLKLVLADGSWLLVRPSGTEPVFRIYAEANTEKQKETIQQEVKATLCPHLREGTLCQI
jgi:alpha-D-glucose phosphate-specific phosphoglucomutase